MRFLALLAAAAVVTAATAPAQAEQITVSQYGRITATLPWAIALKKGFFKDAGLPVDDINSGAGGGTSLRNMLAGPLPIAEISTTAVIPAAKQGLDLKIIMSASNHIGELAWAVKPDSGINSIKDLVGKKIAYTNPKSTTEQVVRQAIKQAGLTGQIEALTLGGLGPALTAFAQGAIASAPLNDPAMTQEPEKYKILFYAQDVFPKFGWSVGVTTREFAEKNPDKVKAFVKLHRRAVEYLYANPAESAQIYAQVWEIDRGLADKLLPKYYNWKHWGLGDFSKEGLQAVVDAMTSVGDLDGPVDWSKLIDQSFLDEDLRRPL